MEEERKRREEESRILKQYTNLVRKLARRYLRPGIDEQDLLQEGYVALIYGWRRYDPAQSDFLTYGYMWVRAHMQAFVAANKGPVRTPTSERHMEIECTAQPARLYTTWWLIDSSPRVAMQHTEDGDTEVEFVAPKVWDPEHIDAHMLMEHLTEREREVMTDVYFRGLYFADVGDHLGVSRERPRQQHEAALEKMRKVVNRKPRPRR